MEGTLGKGEWMAWVERDGGESGEEWVFGVGGLERETVVVWMVKRVLKRALECGDGL